jgi:hypothetical protein
MHQQPAQTQVRVRAGNGGVSARTSRSALAVEAGHWISPSSGSRVQQ